MIYSVYKNIKINVNYYKIRTLKRLIRIEMTELDFLHIIIIIIIIIIISFCLLIYCFPITWIVYSITCGLGI
jgi:hypothetical protein